MTTVIITPADAGARLDTCLSRAIPGLSRARLQALLAQGCVTPAVNAAHRVRAGEVYRVRIPPAAEAAPRAQAMALDIVYEDEHLLVLNKPPGLVVHPGAGHGEGTLVNALLAHCGASLSGIGGVKRPGIVHRLDKETSGLMAVAKNDAAHHGLAEQLASRTLKRVYQAFVWGMPSPAAGRIETRIGRSPLHRTKMAVLTRGGREAITDYAVQESFRVVSRVECRLRTGRTHQIRVHMAHRQNWLVGDPVYGRPGIEKTLRLNKIAPDLAKKIKEFPRQALHAAELEFLHPISKDKIALTAALPPDMQDLLAALRRGQSGGQEDGT